MEFNELLKKYREARGFTQAELAKLYGVSTRMIQNYESGKSRPRFDASEKLAAALGVQITDLMGSNDMLIAQAGDKYGARGAKQAQRLTEELSGLFSGGELSQEDMDIMMKAIQDAYWIAKEKNQRFVPKKHRLNEQ